MALVLADRVKETTTTTGTGTVTLLGASTGFQSFAAVGNANTTYYTIAGQTGSEWEVGIGTYTSAGTTLSRTTVLASSNAGSLVTFSAGTKDVFVTYPSSRSVYANGTVLTASNSSILPATSGGTDNSSYAVGDLLYASTTTALSKLADVATGNAIISGGVGVAPSYGKIGLTTHVSGILPVANGGTNASTASITSFNNITGYTASGATGTTSTNLVFSTSPTLVTPVLGTPTSGTLSNCTVDGTNNVGYLGMPQNAQTGSYTLVAADAGKHIYHASGAGAATYTIPANGSVAYTIGTAVSFINLSSTAISIAITTDTMYLSSAGTTGTRTLAQYGTATAVKVTSTAWIITGSGLT